MIQRAAVALLIIYSTLIVRRAMPDLPERIPTRFDIHGHPTGVSRPETLWLVLASQALVVGLFLLVPYLGRRLPHWVSLGNKRLSDFAPDLRHQILAVIDDACAWMAVGFALFMAMLIRGIVRAAIELKPGPSIWLVVFFVIACAGILGFYAWKYIELDRSAARASAARPPTSSAPPPPQGPAVTK